MIVSWMDPVPPTPRALVFSTVDNIPLLIPTAQNLLTMIDWTGPAYDPNNPRALNAFLLPPSTYSSLLTCPVDLQSPETPVAGTIPQGVYTGTQLTAALQTIVRVSVPGATLTWSEGFRIRFVGSQSFNKYLGTSTMQRNQYVGMTVPANVRQAYRDDLIPGFTLAHNSRHSSRTLSESF